MFRALPAILAVFVVRCALAQDAIQTDPDQYKAMLENDCVRVLDYVDQPGDKTRQHRHPAFVLYALGPFQRTLRLPDGKVPRREFKAGDVMYSEAQTHIGENTATTATHVILVELKGQGNAACGKGRRRVWHVAENTRW